MRLFVHIALLTQIIFAAGIVNGFSQTTGSSLSGSVVDVHGAIFHQAEVVLRREESSRAAPSLSALTDIEGKFVFSDLTAGRYILKVRHAPSRSETRESIEIPDQEVVRVRVVLGIACKEVSESNKVISAQEKAKVFTLALSEAIKVLLTDEERKNGFVLSTENIKRDWIASKPDSRIEVMDRDEIQERAIRSGDFPFISFSKFEDKGACIGVTVVYSWAKEKNSQYMHLDGGGITLEYRKQGNRWIEKYVFYWVS